LQNKTKQNKNFPKPKHNSSTKLTTPQHLPQVNLVQNTNKIKIGAKTNGI
jgi:hypothetical protein